MMRSADERVAIEVLTFLAEIYDEAVDFKCYIRKKFEKASLLRAEPTSYVFCRKRGDGLIMHIWIEAMLEGETSLTWELDIISQEEGWIVDARVCKVAERGTDTVVQFPDLVAPDFATIEREVPTILKELHKAGEHLLEALSPQFGNYSDVALRPSGDGS